MRAWKCRKKDAPQCETALAIDDIDEGLRKELLLTLGAR
jgi:hypothetical protein